MMIDTDTRGVELASFMLAVLGLLAEMDRYSEPIYWATHDGYAPITFFVNCNDFFWWATADAERLMPEDLPMLRQALTDSKKCCDEGKGAEGGEDDDWGFLLFCARKRKMRPQQPAYPTDARLRALFDACGPNRQT